MKFVVKTLSSSRHDIDIDGTETVASLKNLLKDKTNIDPARQKLIFLGRVLQDDKVLSEYDLEGKVLHLVESNPPAADSGAPAPPPPHQEEPHPTEPISDHVLNSILNSLGIDANRAQIRRQRVDDGRGGVAVSFNISDWGDEPFSVRIEDSPLNPGANVSATPSETPAQPRVPTTPAAPAWPGPGPEINIPQPPQTGAAGAAIPSPNNMQASARPHLDRIINHLRVVRDTMRHIPCTADNARNVISETLQAPCIRQQHYSGPTEAEGATPEEIQRRATSRESVETYSHILIDTADIMQEMVRYMNQYGRLLHHDPPLEGGDLAHASNLVTRMAAAFHEMSHAFHLLSDYGITLSNMPPRRLWMAQLTGASILVQEGPTTGASLANLLSQARRGTQTRGDGTVLTGLGTESAQDLENLLGRAGNESEGQERATSTLGSTPPDRETPPTDDNNNPAVAISIDMPFPGALGRRTPLPLPRSNLPCTSRHRATALPIRCPVHQRNPQPRLHTHTHTHRPGHVHAHGPRPSPIGRRGAGGNTSDPAALRALNEALGRDPSRQVPQSAPPPNMPDPAAQLAQVLGLSGPDGMQAVMQIARTITTSNPNQRISEYWPTIRSLMMHQAGRSDSQEDPFSGDNHLGHMLHIIASNFSFGELVSALNNYEMLDVVYQPLRDYFTNNLFHTATPTWQHINDTVVQVVTQSRSAISLFFGIQQSEGSDVDEQRTMEAMVREFVRTVFRGLYSDRGDVAAGFGQVLGRSIRRLTGLLLAYITHINTGGNNQERAGLQLQVQGILERVIPFDNITREELFDYVVPLSHESDEEFVDAPESTEESRDEEMSEEKSSRTSAAPEPAPEEKEEAEERTSHCAHPDTPLEDEIPTEWKRVIEADARTLNEATYSALSDGYLSSLPAKRRKTDTSYSDRPDEVLSALLEQSSEGAGDLANHDELSSLFKDKLKQDLKKKLEHNDDVDPDTFPACSKLRRG